MDHADPAAYRFDEYLAALGSDWLADDPLLGRWLEGSRLGPDDRALVEAFGRAVATRYRDAAERVERRENRPTLERDPYNRRTAEVVIPAETRRVPGEILFGRPPLEVPAPPCGETHPGRFEFTRETSLQALRWLGLCQQERDADRGDHSLSGLDTHPREGG